MSMAIEYISARLSAFVVRIFEESVLMGSEAQNKVWTYTIPSAEKYVDSLPDLRSLRNA